MNLLVFQHVPHEHAGQLAAAAAEQGVALTIIELWRPYVIPSLSDYRGLIVLGGPMGVYEDSDKFPSKADELASIREAVGNIPILGICLGSQLLAHALGGRVYPNIRAGKRVKEIGYYDVTLTDAGKVDPLFAGLPSPLQVLEWHGDAFDLPAGAALLATTPGCANQAFRYGAHAYGTLFHLEFTSAMVAKLIEVDRAWIHDGVATDEATLLTQAETFAPILEQHCRMMFTNFLALTPKR